MRRVNRNAIVGVMRIAFRDVKIQIRAVHHSSGNCREGLPDVLMRTDGRVFCFGRIRNFDWVLSDEIVTVISNFADHLQPLPPHQQPHIQRQRLRSL